MSQVHKLLDQVEIVCFFIKLDFIKGYWQIPKKRICDASLQFVQGPSRSTAPHGPGAVHMLLMLPPIWMTLGIYSEHLQWVAAVLESWRQAGLTANPKKYAVGGGGGVGLVQ